jgi:hypothetical protein
VGVFLCLPWSSVVMFLSSTVFVGEKFSKEGRGWRKAFVYRCSRAYRNASVASCVARKRIMEYALVQIHILNDKIV